MTSQFPLGLVLFVSILFQGLVRAHADQDGLATDYVTSADAEWTAEAATAKTRDAIDAPLWVQAARTRRLEHYFPLVTLAPDAHAAAVERVRHDLRDLHAYFERDVLEDPLVRRTGDRLDAFAARLSHRRVMTARVGQMEELRDLTLERIIADEAAKVARRARSPWVKLGALLGVRHLRGATSGATLQVISHVARWCGRQFTADRDLHWRTIKPVLKVVVPVVGAGLLVDHFTRSHLVTGFLLGSVWGAVQAGPMARLLSASTDWFLKPTTQFVKIWSRRRTGNAEQEIQKFFGALKVQMGAEESMDQVRVASLERDNSNIADMPPAMQVRAVHRALAIFVALKNSWGRLLNDTEHHGRWLLTTLWSDELDTINLVNGSLGEIETLDSSVKLVLMPFRNKMVMEGKFDDNDALITAYADLKRALERHDWFEHQLTPALEAKVLDFADRLRRLRVPEVEVQEILDHQKRRSLLISTVVTGLAVNEARYLLFPEANRNMPDEARSIQREIRQAFRIQHYVKYFESQIQTVHRAMGLRDDTCEQALDPAAAMTARAA